MSKQSEIARQFDLPERQSKLNTMLREEGLKDEQVYCICRSSDASRFMIGCDHCEEWYHGDCINVTEHEANKIRKFYCKKCRTKYPALQIKYKKRSHHHHHHKHRHDKDKYRQKDSQKDREQSSKSKMDKLDEKCGECEACYIQEDCGRCEYCKDMHKFGGTGKLRQKCKKRQCQNFFHLAKKHHQTSGSKSSSEKHSTDYSRSDHSYNSQSKVAPKPPSTPDHSYNSQSKVAPKPPSTPQSTVGKTPTGSLIIKSLSQYSTISTCTPVTTSSTVSVRGTAVETPPPAPPPPPPPPPLPPAPPVVQKTSEVVSSKVTSVICPLANLTNSNNNRSPSAVTTTTNSAVTTTTVTTTTTTMTAILDNKDVSNYNNPFVDNDEPWEPIKRKKGRETVPRKRKDPTTSRKRKPQESGSDSDDPWDTLDAQGPRQCMGPQCVKTARPTSKYCSEECGLKLAEARIYSVLPQRIQEWKMSSCLAEEKDRKQLEKIRAQQLEARRALQALDEKHKALDTLLEKWKSVSIDPQADEEGDEDGSEGAFVYCVTCGHEVPTRRAIKHMHSCYNKLESQMSFGSMFKTRIEGNNMFCDAYNASNRTYCKRLRVMCPEHTKESKISNTEVCGFPLTTDIFTETGKVCRMSKKKCVRHYCWEKLRRASIDMERVRQCLKLDELVEQERQVRLAMTNRAGVLGLMLHSTYDHGYAAKVQKQQHRQQQRQTDHQYHQKEKSQPSTDFHHSQLKDSTNYHSHHHQINSDHHYHRQQPDGGQETITKQSSHSNKKYQSKFSSNSSSITSANQMYHTKLNQQFNSSLTPTSKSSNQSHQHAYQSDHYYHTDKQFNHDHQYFSNQPNAVDDKRDDHLYYSSKRHK